MGKHGGYPGGMPGNMANLMKQAQRMQAEMQEKQAALEEKEFTVSTGGGAVTLVMTGKREVKSLTLAGETVIGSETKTGLFLQNSSSYAPNVVAGALTSGSKIGISASRTGTVVHGGAAYIDLFEQKKGENYKLEVSGEDIVLAEN